MKRLSKEDGIEVEDHAGTWRVIDILYEDDFILYLLESEEFGDKVPYVIIDNEETLVMDDVDNIFRQECFLHII